MLVKPSSDYDQHEQFFLLQSLIPNLAKEIAESSTQEHQEQQFVTPPSAEGNSIMKPSHVRGK